MDDSLLNIDNLGIEFYTDGTAIRAVDELSLKIRPGETIGIVGESGCGKSTTSLAIMRLLPKQNSAIVSGTIIFGNNDLVKLSDKEMRNIRGKDIAMIFQDPMTSLNPVYTIGKQLTEGIILHQKVSKSEARKQAIDMLQKVNIPRPEMILNNYPHELSGGMRQRVMIAMALSCSPSILIADEPTTALDVTVQAQILDLMNELKAEKHMAIIMITHDLGVVAEMCQYIYIMYAGQVVETTSIDDLLNHPLHPYTQGLLASMPENCAETDRLFCIQGNVPLPSTVITGCRFADRCACCEAHCKKEAPPLIKLDDIHSVRCFRFRE